jgi:plastocyanin
MRLAFAVAAATALLSACGSSSSSSSSSGSAAPAANASQVSMKGLAFSPSTIQGKVGQTITFVNDDTPAHNVEPDGGVSFKGSPTLQPGATWKLRLTQPGTFHYFCSIHPFMKGTIVVK